MKRLQNRTNVSPPVISAIRNLPFPNRNVLQKNSRQLPLTEKSCNLLQHCNKKNSSNLPHHSYTHTQHTHPTPFSCTRPRTGAPLTLSIAYGRIAQSPRRQ